jgi:uncharacterized protein
MPSPSAATGCRYTEMSEPDPSAVDTQRANPNADERSWAMLAHLSAFAGLILPLAGNVVGPLLVWYTRRTRSQFVAEQATEALNFNILVLLGFALCGALALIFIGFLLGLVLLVYWIVMTIRAGIKAGEGIHYRYPVSVRFVR